MSDEDVDFETRRTFPVQIRSRRNQAVVNRKVYLAVYEVYERVCGEQKALLEGWCRGGFGINEVVAFLYARSFPKSEWRQRFDEAIEDMDVM